MAIAIEFRHVKKEYQAQKVIQDLNLTIHKGELFVLVGESGSGKTTTLKMINRLEELNAGEIFINGNNIANISKHELRQDIGYVLQQIALFPTMTVAQNIAVIPEMKGMNKTEIHEITHELLTDVGLDPENYWSRKPNELSGGEQQRIGILRAVAAQPSIILMDEPFSALDPLSRQQLQNLVIRMHEKYHSTIVFVTHDMNEALKLGDKVGIMSKGEIVQVATPTQIAKNPTNDFVRNFFSASRAKNIYDIYLGHVGMAQGYLTEQPIGMIKELDEQDTLRDAFAILVDYEYVAITNKDKILGYLSRKQIISYLNQHEKA